MDFGKVDQVGRVAADVEVPEVHECTFSTH